VQCDAKRTNFKPGQVTDATPENMYYASVYNLVSMHRSIIYSNEHDYKYKVVTGHQKGVTCKFGTWENQLASVNDAVQFSGMKKELQEEEETLRLLEYAGNKARYTCQI
jgi:hypothetical protein